MINTISASDIGTLFLDGPKITALLNHPAVNAEFSTSTLKNHLPILAEKIGLEKELTMEYSWKDVKVLLGNYDADVILEYTMQITLVQFGSIELMYDEVRCITTMNLWTESDILYAHFINWKLDMDSFRFGGEKT